MSSIDIALPERRSESQEIAFPWIVFLPLALIPFFGSSADGLNQLILAAQLLLFAAGVRRPVFIVAALILSEMTAANYMHVFGGVEISNRLVLSLAAIPIVLPNFVQRPDLGPRAKSMFVFALAFVAVSTLANAVYSDAGFLFQFLRYIATGIILLFLIPATIRNRTDLRDLALVGVAVAGLSALVAVLQHYSGQVGTPIYEVVPHPGSDGSFDSFQGRSIGLSENPVDLNNIMLVAPMTLLGVLLVAPAANTSRRLLLLLLTLMVAGLYFTYTRSWAYAAPLGLLSMGLLYRGRYSREFWLLLLVAAAGFWYWSDMRATRYSLGPEEESSAAARPVLWTVSLNIALENPFLGVGHDAFLDLSPEYASTVDPDLLERQGAGGVLGVYTPHNDFLNIWLSFGVFALVFYLAVVFLTARNFIEVYSRASDPLLKGLAVGGLGALVAFQMNSFIHNFFDSTLTMWALAGLSLALTKLVVPRPPSREAR